MMPDHLPPHSQSSLIILRWHWPRFRKCLVLSVEIEVEAVRGRGENTFLHQVPVRSKFSNLVLKRGMSQDDYCI